MKRCIACFLLIFSLFSPVFGQIIADSFDRANLANGPVPWHIQVSHPASSGFILQSQTLRPSRTGTGTQTYSLAAPFAPIPAHYHLQWNLSARLNFIVTSATLENSNHARFYLLADTLSSLGNLNGYFLRLDYNRCRFYRQSGATATEIPLPSGAPTLQLGAWNSLTVSRSPSGKWAFWVNDAFAGEVVETTFQQGNTTGFWVRSSTTARAHEMFFDSLQVWQYPDLLEARAVGDSTVKLRFSAPIDPIFSSQTIHYQLNGTQSPTAVQTLPDQPEALLLTFAEAFQDSSDNIIEVLALQETSALRMPTDRSLEAGFTYFAPDRSPPFIKSVIGRENNQIWVDWNELVRESAADPASYQIKQTGKRTIRVEQHPDRAGSWLLTFAEVFQFGDSLELCATGVADTAGNVATATCLPFVFNDTKPPHIQRVKLISANVLELVFSEK